MFIHRNHFTPKQWLERTPGLETDGFDFWGKFEANVDQALKCEKQKIEVCMMTFCEETVIVAI